MRTWIVCLIASVALPALAGDRTQPPQAIPDFRGVTRRVLDRTLAVGPSLATVHRQVLAASGLLVDETEAWARHARRAAALPRLMVGLRHSFQDNLDLSLKDSVSVTSGGVVIGPRASDVAQRSDRNTFVEARAVWALNELLFTSDSLQVSQEARNRRREIRELLHAATQLYAERQQLLAALGAGRRHPTAAIAAWRLRLAEVTGELDALTGGWFAPAVAHPEGGG